MTLKEMIELGALFQRLGAIDGAAFSETIAVCRVDQISGITAADLSLISKLASALARANLGTLAIFGQISGEVDLLTGNISSIEGEAASLRLTKTAEPNAAYFVTRAGFEAALADAQFMLCARKIWIAEDFFTICHKVMHLFALG